MYNFVFNVPIKFTNAMLATGVYRWVVLHSVRPWRIFHRHASQRKTVAHSVLNRDATTADIQVFNS